MTSRIGPIDLDAWFANTAGGAGNGNGKYMGVGMGNGAWSWQNRFGLRIPRGGSLNLDAIPSAAAISDFIVHLRCSNANFGIGSAVKFYLERSGGVFTEYQVVAGQGGVPAGANISAYVTSAGPASAHWPGPSGDATSRGSYTGSPANGDWIAVHMPALGQWWYGQTGPLVLVGIAFDETATAQRCTFYTKDSGSAPYAEVVFGGNSPPAKPVNVQVVNGSDGTSFTVTADYNDPDGDPSPTFEALFTPDPTQ